jgi:hypothetical protein
MDVYDPWIESNLRGEENFSQNKHCRSPRTTNPNKNQNGENHAPRTACTYKFWKIECQPKFAQYICTNITTMLYRYTQNLQMAHRNTNTAAMLCDYHQKHATLVITQFITNVTMGVKVHQHSRMRTTQQSYDISEYSTVSANKHARPTTLTMKRGTLTKKHGIRNRYLQDWNHHHARRRGPIR